MAENIDLSCSESMEDLFFPEVDGLTNEDLANLNVEEIGRQQTLLQDFPRCHISAPEKEEAVPTTGDLLEGVLRETLSQTEIYRLERTDIQTTNLQQEVDREQDGRPIPVEITARYTGESIPTAKKSPPNEEQMESENEQDLTNQRSDSVSQGNQHMDEDKEDISTEQQQDQDSRGQQQQGKKDNGMDNGSRGNQSQRRRQNNGQKNCNGKKAQSKRVEDKQGGEKLRFSFESVKEFPIPLKTTEEKVSVSSQITQSVILKSTAEKDGILTRNGESGFLAHNFPSVSSDELRGPDPAPDDLESGKFSSVRELALPENKTTRTVPSGIIPFILVEFMDGKWSVVSIDKWAEITNQLEFQVLQGHPDLRWIMKQARRWRGCGSFNLDGHDLTKLEKWRDLLPLMDGNLNTFPRDALTVSEELTIMLMGDLKSYKIEALPYSLFTRNTTLRGHVRVVCSKKYGSADYTSKFISKEGWKLCYLEGDAVFMESLKQHSNEDKFEVGCGLVTIRGGVRKPSFLRRPFFGLPWSNRTWTRDSSEPILRTLTPIPIRTSTPVPIQRASSLPIKTNATDIKVNMVKKNEKGSMKPRTRSERLRIARLKKAAIRLQMEGKK